MNKERLNYALFRLNGRNGINKYFVNYKRARSHYHDNPIYGSYDAYNWRARMWVNFHLRIFKGGWDIEPFFDKTSIVDREL